MYALFPETFRENIGVPLHYESILHTHFGQPIQPSTEMMSVDVDMETSGPPTLLDITVHEELQLQQSAVFVDRDDDNKTLSSVDYKANTHELVANAQGTNDVTTAVVLRKCSLCAKQFPKSKSHRGTRCWSCKKSQSRSDCIRTKSTSSNAPVDSADSS